MPRCKLKIDNNKTKFGHQRKAKRQFFWEGGQGGLGGTKAIQNHEF